MSWTHGLGLLLWMGTGVLVAAAIGLDDSLLHAPTILRIS